MREADKLKTVLMRAAQKTEEKSVKDAALCMSKILEEIDTVVLPRDLLLANGVGQTLSVTVKSRRLIRVNTPAPQVTPETLQVGDRELSSDQTQMTALVNLIAEFSAGATELTASLSDPANPEVLSEVGLSVDQLKKSFKAAGYVLAERNVDILTALTDIAQDQNLIWARFNGIELQASAGDVMPLRAAHATTLPHIMKAEKPLPGHAATWMLGTGGGARLSITVEDEACVIAIIPDALTHTWISASAGRLNC